MLPETRNVLQLGAAFFFIFLAFNSQGSLSLSSWLQKVIIGFSGFIEVPVIQSASKTGGISQNAGSTRYGSLSSQSAITLPV